MADAVAFARWRPETSQRWHAQRLHVIGGLARYVHALDPAAAELVPAGLIRARVTRRHPYLYSSAQIEALLAAASALSPPPLAAAMSTLIGLLSVSGMRVGEVTALDVGDLDTDRQVLRVTGKYGKRRLVPLHPSTVEVLKSYLGGRPADGPLFVGVRGNRLNANTARAVFGALVQECGLEARPGCGAPRLHDFRHSFAVHSLIEAQRSDSDVDARVAVLTDYLGHVNPACTYWYLEASPQLMAAVSERVVASFRREHR
ncbi:MAG: tyrosine-type recombinase/integrase [Actinobacteria bacterium]|nr:tyrosine-type recombinase/integrase [Actinomycetota bacterium]